MRALTIHQPYAELIARGEKRVENRPQRLHYRGLLVIHAGQRSRIWLERAKADGVVIDEEELVFGAAIAVADLVDCVDYGAVRSRRELFAGGDRHGWIARDRWASGPQCLVLENVRRLPKPIPCSGRQSLWIPPAEVVAAIEGQL